MTTTMVSGVVVVQMLFILPVRTKNATAIAEGAGMLRCRRSSYRIEQVRYKKKEQDEIFGSGQALFFRKKYPKAGLWSNREQ